MHPPSRRSPWGSPRAFAELGVALLALTLLVNTHSALIKQICAIAILLAMATASVIVLWRIWKHRGQATPPRLASGN